MKDNDGINKELSVIYIYVASAIVVWTIILGASLMWNMYSEKKATGELAKREARANFNKDQAFRFWGAKHGGVYVPDGEDAVNVFVENKDEIQLVLFDVIMPKKNGKEAYEEIKKTVPEIKALFMSGYTADIIGRKGALEEGVNFISKPVIPDELLRKARELLDG